MACHSEFPLGITCGKCQLIFDNDIARMLRLSGACHDVADFRGERRSATI